MLAENKEAAHGSPVQCAQLLEELGQEEGREVPDLPKMAAAQTLCDHL